MDTLSLTKEAKIYNGEKTLSKKNKKIKKTLSLTSGAGKTGQPPVKQCN